MGLCSYSRGVWNERCSVVCSMRKSSMNNCRPTLIGMTDGRFFKYGTERGSRDVSERFFGGQSFSRQIPISSISVIDGYQLPSSLVLLHCLIIHQIHEAKLSTLPRCL